MLHRVTKSRRHAKVLGSPVAAPALVWAQTRVKGPAEWAADVGGHLQEMAAGAKLARAQVLQLSSMQALRPLVLQLEEHLPPVVGSPLGRQVATLSSTVRRWSLEFLKAAHRLHRLWTAHDAIQALYMQKMHGASTEIATA